MIYIEKRVEMVSKTANVNDITSLFTRKCMGMSFEASALFSPSFEHCV